MKVWIKYLIGIALGVLSALILPLDTAAGTSALNFLTELFVRFGRYIVVPAVFFTAVVSVGKLRNSRLFFRTSAWTFGIIIISSFLLAAVGLISILLVRLPRIPITVDASAEAFSIDVKGMILSLFPYSAFDSLREGSFLLVSFLFAGFIGWGTASDQSAFRPVFTLADSLSKLFYNIAVGFTEVMAVCIVAIMCSWTITFRSVIMTGIYTPMILMLICDFVIIAGIIYPLILYFLCHDPHPYRVLFAALAPMLLAFFSGDSNMTLPLSIRHGKESLGIRRRSGGFTFPLFSVFARGGSALVVTIGFILIWRSYSSLSLPVQDVLWIFGMSFGLSFLLGSLPSGGAFVLLSILCSVYGRGFETSFILLKPAALIICSFASLFDAVTAVFGSYIIAVKTKMIEHHTLSHFI